MVKPDLSRWFDSQPIHQSTVDKLNIDFYAHSFSYVPGS
jgi:hypothetical protein